jgi:hypothetical protein
LKIQVLSLHVQNYLLQFIIIIIIIIIIVPSTHSTRSNF